MADFSKFRTAINGFHRADVASYIEILCIEHQKELKQLRKEAEDLSQQLEDAKDSLKVQTMQNDALRMQLEEKEAALQEALTLLTEPDEQEVPTGDTAEEALPSEETPEDATDYVSLELEAYRRAEATERLAAERAARLRMELNDLLDNVSSRYEQTGQEIQVLTEDIRTNLKRLQDTLSDLDVIFDEATESFDSMDSMEILGV